jgi:LysM repeat protein
MKKMSEFENRTDQAGNLRTKMIDEYKEQHGDYPPRGEVHKDKEKKTKLKMKYPVISLLALFFILLPILFLSITFYYGSSGNQSANGKNSSEDETVYISNEQQSDEETEPEEEGVESDTPVEEEIAIDENEEMTSNDNEISETESEDKIIESLDQQEYQTNDSMNDASEKTDSAESNESEYREVKNHKVAAGETLFIIAIKYYKSRSGEEIIRQYNGIEANNIYEGQILKIPLK